MRGAGKLRLQGFAPEQFQIEKQSKYTTKGPQIKNQACRLNRSINLDNSKSAY